MSTGVRCRKIGTAQGTLMSWSRAGCSIKIFGATTVGLYGPGWWTYEASHELIARYPDLAWDFVMAVLKTNPDELTQATLAAGPIEDLLVAHGPYLIGRIEQKVRLEPELREVFRNVWKSKMRPDVWARLQELLR